MSGLQALPAAVTRPPASPAGWRLRRVRPGLVLAWLVIVVVVLWAVSPGLFTGYSATEGIAGQQLQPPSAAHLLGTDQLGRDVLARIIHGAVHSLAGATVAVGVGLALGTALGVVAGALGGVADAAVMRIVDVLLSIPSLLLSLSIIVLLGFGTVHAAIAVGIGAVASFARLVRSEVVWVRGLDCVEAAYGSGGTVRFVLWRHVLPNSLRFSRTSRAVVALPAIPELTYGGGGLG